MMVSVISYAWIRRLLTAGLQMKGTKVKVVFYSMYGHTHKMAEAVAAGAREVEGARVEVLQVPELVPDEVLERSGAKKVVSAVTTSSQGR